MSLNCEDCASRTVEPKLSLSDVPGLVPLLTGMCNSQELGRELPETYNSRLYGL